MSASYRHCHTVPINPAGAEPVLSAEQVWKGLQRKVRSPTEFVPVIESCEVVSDENDVVTRLVQFKSGWGPEGKVKEVCSSYNPTHIYFEMESGDKVYNIVSSGPSGEPTDLHLTYMFEIKPSGSDFETMVKGGKGAVAGTVAKLREFAKAGEL